MNHQSTNCWIINNSLTQKFSILYSISKSFIDDSPENRFLINNYSIKIRKIFFPFNYPKSRSVRSLKKILKIKRRMRNTTMKKNKYYTITVQTKASNTTIMIIVSWYHFERIILCLLWNHSMPNVRLFRIDISNRSFIIWMVWSQTIDWN